MEERNRSSTKPTEREPQNGQTAQQVGSEIRNCEYPGVFCRLIQQHTTLPAHFPLLARVFGTSIFCGFAFRLDLSPPLVIARSPNEIMFCYDRVQLICFYRTRSSISHTSQAKGDPSFPEELHTAHVLSSLNGDAGNHGVLLPLGFCDKDRKDTKTCGAAFCSFMSSWASIRSFIYLCCL